MNVPLDDMIEFKARMDELNEPERAQGIAFYDDDGELITMSYEEVVDYLARRMH